MKLFTFWAHSQVLARYKEGYPLVLKKWAGSNISEEDARVEAERRVAILKEKLAVGDDGFLDYSYYSTRDLPEELIERIGEQDGVTRTRYGTLVLNTQRLGFVDIDFEPRPFWMKLVEALGIKKKPNPEDESIAHLEQWLKTRPERAVRVYRTYAGLRYIIVDAPCALDEATFVMMKELKADPLYVRLCKVQDCFRARLTPKPWRIDTDKPPGYYPRDEKQQQLFERWQADYERQGDRFAVCRFIAQKGHRDIAPDLESLIVWHDNMTRVHRSGLPLA